MKKNIFIMYAEFPLSLYREPLIENSLSLWRWRSWSDPFVLSVPLETSPSLFSSINRGEVKRAIRGAGVLLLSDTSASWWTGYFVQWYDEEAKVEVNLKPETLTLSPRVFHKACASHPFALSFFLLYFPSERRITSLWPIFTNLLS